MGMFDWYQPAGTFQCPVCGYIQREWQGKDGPCGLFMFHEGTAGAVAQWVDEEDRLPEKQISSQILPDEFFIKAHDCKCVYPTRLRCIAQGGAWKSSELFTGSTDDRQLRGPETHAQWQARLKWLDSCAA